MDDADARLASIRDDLLLSGNPIMRSLPDVMIVVFDGDLRYLSAGGQGLADVELNAGILVGRTIFETFPPEVVARIEPLYRAALRGEESSYDVGYNDRVYLQRLTPVRDEGGRIVAGLGIGRDVTESRQQQRDLAEEQRRLRDAQSIGQLGSWEMDLVTGEITWSDTLLELFGLDPAECDPAYLRSLAIVHDDDRPEAIAIIKRCADTGAPFQLRHRIVRVSDGALRWVHGQGQRITAPDGGTRIVGTLADVTEVTVQIAAEAKARARHAFQEAVITASPDIIFVYDVATRTTVWSNRSLTELLGFGDADIADIDHVPPEEQGAFTSAVEDSCAASDNETIQYNHRVFHADGSTRWFSRRTTPLHRDAFGTVTQLVGALRDITDAVELEHQLTHSALHDDLTGLPNRALLVDRLDTALARTRREGREVGVLFCDLDGFKRVNDAAGHAAGDAVLMESAARLQSVLRDGDTIARVGGDEFVVLIEPWNRTDAEENALDPDAVASLDRTLAPTVAARIAEALQRPFVFRGVEHVVTASIGITYAGLPTVGAKSAMTADQVLQDADAAMYQAKRLGKDRFAVFEHIMSTDLVERGRVEQVLRQALRTRAGVPTDLGSWTLSRQQHPSLQAAYQPVFDSRDGSLVSFEALARLTNAHGTAIGPDVFIPIAEDTGIIRSLGAVMLDSACAQLAAWRRATPGLDGVTMAVNVSPYQAQHPSLQDEVRRALDRHGLQPRDLILELTESALLQAAHSTMTVLHGLYDDGLGIAIDDFGTGYASLKYLTTLPVTAVKIDRSFTAGITTDDTSRKIIKAVAGLAADLDLQCVVEGVETSAQRLALPVGVLVQGWLTGRAVPSDELDLPLLVAQGAG